MDRLHRVTQAWGRVAQSGHLQPKPVAVEPPRDHDAMTLRQQAADDETGPGRAVTRVVGQRFTERGGKLGLRASHGGACSTHDRDAARGRPPRVIRLVPVQRRLLRHQSEGGRRGCRPTADGVGRTEVHPNRHDRHHYRDQDKGSTHHLSIRRDRSSQSPPLLADRPYPFCESKGGTISMPRGRALNMAVHAGDERGCEPLHRLAR